MDICVKEGIRKFFFADPSFTYDKARTKKMMGEIIKRKWKINIWCETRSDMVDSEVLRIMAKAGVKKIAYGLESVDDKVNRIINKKINVEEFAEILNETQKNGIEAEVFTLYGLPGQDKKSCLNTLEFLKSMGVRISGNSGGQQLNLFYGTDIADAPGKYGIKLDKRKRPLYLSPGIDFSTDFMTKKDIKEIALIYGSERDKNKKSGTEENCVGIV